MQTITKPSASGAVAQTAQQFVAGVRERVAKIVVGQDVVVERVMIALLTGGHLLLQGSARASRRRCS